MQIDLDKISAYPLEWPSGWRRKASKISASFHSTSSEVRQPSYPGGSSYTRTVRKSLTVADGVKRIMLSLSKMGIHTDQIVISSNLRPRLDGMPASGQREPEDSGASVYWRTRGATRCMAIDQYDRVADNLAAIAATLEAMRAIERHGGAAILDRAFIGFKALAEPEQWWQVLGLKDDRATREQIEKAYLDLANRHHPDRGGDNGTMARINAARDRGLKELAAA